MVGNIIRLLRKVNENATIKEVANGIGCSSAYLSKVEKETKNISLTMLQKIADYHNIPASMILNLSELQDKENLSNQEIMVRMLEYYIDKERLEFK